MRALSVSVVLFALSGCSLIVGDFTECKTDAECTDSRVCSTEGYCVFPIARSECAGDGDCAPGLVCTAGACVQPAVPEGCGRTEGAFDAPDAVWLGAALPITSGDATDQSEVMGLNAMLLALDEVNQREGVGGRRFALHVCDTSGDADRIRQQVSWLSQRYSVPAVLTSGSGQTLAASTVSVPRGVVLMTATATSPELTALPDQNDGSVGLVWRTAPSDAIQGAVIADRLLADPQIEKVGLVYLKDPYGEGLATVLIEAFQGQAGRSLLPISYNRGGAVDAAVTQLAGFEPDLTVLVGFPDDLVRVLNGAAATAQLGTGSGHRWFFTDSAKDPALIAGLTTMGQVEGSLGTAPAQGAGSAYDQFSSSFTSRFGVNPGQFSFTSHSYDAFYLLALGAAHAAGADGTGEITGRRLAEGLTKLSSGTPYRLRPSDLTAAKAALGRGETIDVEGASGKLDFNAATGEAPSPVEIWRIEGTEFRVVEQGVEPPAP